MQNILYRTSLIVHRTLIFHIVHMLHTHLTILYVIKFTDHITYFTVKYRRLGLLGVCIIMYMHLLLYVVRNCYALNKVYTLNKQFS